MKHPDTTFPERLSVYERGWIAGWLLGQGIANPSFEEFREALFAMLFLFSGVDGPMH